MKKLSLVLSLAFLSLTFFPSMAVISHNENENLILLKEDQNKKKITFEELPEKVKEAFSSSEYSDWTVQEVYEVTPQEEEQSYYTLQVQKEDQKQTLSYTEDGEEKAEKS